MTNNCDPDDEVNFNYQVVEHRELDDSLRKELDNVFSGEKLRRQLKEIERGYHHD